MARDLHAVETDRRPVEETLTFEPEPPAPPVPDIDRQLRAVRREQQVAGIAVMLLDAAKILEPVAAMLSDRALQWAALLSTVGLTAYALRAPSWERAAIVAGFAVLAPWIIRRGRG